MAWLDAQHSLMGLMVMMVVTARLYRDSATHSSLHFGSDRMMYVYLSVREVSPPPLPAGPSRRDRLHEVPGEIGEGDGNGNDRRREALVDLLLVIANPVDM